MMKVTVFTIRKTPVYSEQPSLKEAKLWGYNHAHYEDDVIVVQENEVVVYRSIYDSLKEDLG